MRIHNPSSKEWMKAVGVGVATAVLLSAVMVPASISGIAPMPQPLGPAFAETVTGADLPLDCRPPRPPVPENP